MGACIIRSLRAAFPSRGGGYAVVSCIAYNHGSSIGSNLRREDTHAQESQGRTARAQGGGGRRSFEPAAVGVEIVASDLACGPGRVRQSAERWRESVRGARAA